MTVCTIYIYIYVQKAHYSIPSELKQTLYIDEITDLTAHNGTVKRQLASKSQAFSVVVKFIQEL